MNFTGQIKFIIQNFQFLDHYSNLHYIVNLTLLPIPRLLFLGLKQVEEKSTSQTLQFIFYCIYQL